MQTGQGEESRGVLKRRSHQSRLGVDRWFSETSGRGYVPNEPSHPLGGALIGLVLAQVQGVDELADRVATLVVLLQAVRQ
jgi:hypothetical protein